RNVDPGDARFIVPLLGGTSPACEARCTRRGSSLRLRCKPWQPHRALTEKPDCVTPPRSAARQGRGPGFRIPLLVIDGVCRSCEERESCQATDQTRVRPAVAGETTWDVFPLPQPDGAPAD